MAAEFDPRIIKIGLEVDGQIEFFEDLYITAQGTRFGSDVNNECQIRIDNLTREHRNYILNRTSPFKRPQGVPLPKISVYAGRKSYGTSLVWTGQVTTSFVTQPPEIGIILNCLTAFEEALMAISYNTGPQASMRSIAQKAAGDLGVTLNFQATDKQISNFSFSGDATKFVKKLSEMGNVNATVDNNELIVKDQDLCLVAPVKKISQETGMIGIPEFTDKGVLVRYLFDNNTFLFQNVQIESVMNPSVNGNYQLFKLGFDLSTRAQAFYWIAECAPTFAAVSI